MLDGINRETDTYASLYHGQTLLVKVSGAEINSTDFPTLVKDVNGLNESGVKVVLVFGGGNQIDEEYGKPRKKIDGVAVTTKEELQLGVLPAYRKIRAQLLDAFPRGVMLEPGDILCDEHPDARYDRVGAPREIVLPDKKLVMVGFVGAAGDSLLNVNADDIAMQIARNKEVEELFFLTRSGGVLDNEKKIVPLLTEKQIEEILEGTHKKVTADGGMKKKLAVTRQALDVIEKIVMTTTSGVRDEIEKWMGSGTMLVNSKKLSMSPMGYKEAPIFDAVNDAYVQNGTFRRRTPKELEELKTHHQMLRAKKSPLGGLSLVPRGDWVELAGLWAGSIGNGIGQMLLQSAKEEAGKRKMYAFSSEQGAIAAFGASGLFDDLGTISQAKSKLPSDAPDALKNYNKEGRDPHVFLAR